MLTGSEVASQTLTLVESSPGSLAGGGGAQVQMKQLRPEPEIPDSEIPVRLW